jgi:hypothetical protein
MMSVFKGQIAYFHYSKHHKDRNPMLLILYTDNKIVHGLNMHYLNKNAYRELISVVAQIAAKQIENKNAYDLYHRELKKRIKHILKVSYRTYKPQYIQSVNIVSNGFNETIGWLSQDKSIVIKKYEKAIDLKIQKAEPKTPEELKKIKNITSQQILMKIDEYFNTIKNIRKKRIDKQRYTSIKPWKNLTR